MTAVVAPQTGTLPGHGSPASYAAHSVVLQTDQEGFHARALWLVHNMVASSLQASGERKLRQLSVLVGDGSKPFSVNSEPISLTISLHPDEDKSRSHSKASVASLPPKSL